MIPLDSWSFRYRILLKKAFSQIQAWCLNEMPPPFLFLEFLEDKSNYTPQLYLQDILDAKKELVERMKKLRDLVDG